jgi:hypothetical protein
MIASEKHPCALRQGGFQGKRDDERGNGEGGGAAHFTQVITARFSP